VLERQQDVGQLISLARDTKTLLEGERLSVLDCAEVAYP
jgi:hypothetical protein